MNDEAVIKLVFGMRGCGKSEKVRKLVRNVRRLLVVDTIRRDYTGGVIFYSLKELKQFWRKVYLGDFRLIYRPHGTNADRIEDIAEICLLCKACENMTLVVEELNIVFDDKRPPMELNEMIFGGRHSGIELIGVAQRPVGFGRDFTSQAKEFYVFTNCEPDDVKYFRYHLGKEAAEAIRNLEQYQYVKWIMADGVRDWEICKDEVL